MKSKQTAAPDRLGYSVPDALATGAFPNRNKLYRAIASGEIASWKDGRSRIISGDSLREYVQRKTREGRMTAAIKPPKAASGVDRLVWSGVSKR